MRIIFDTVFELVVCFDGFHLLCVWEYSYNDIIYFCKTVRYDFLIHKSTLNQRHPAKTHNRRRTRARVAPGFGCGNRSCFQRRCRLGQLFQVQMALSFVSGFFNYKFESIRT